MLSTLGPPAPQPRTLWEGTGGRGACAIRLNIFRKKRSKIIKHAPKIGSERPTNPFGSQMAPKTRKWHLKKRVGSISGPPFGRPKPIKIDEKSINIFDTFFGRPFDRLWHRFGSILPPCSPPFWITFPKQRFYEK